MKDRFIEDLFPKRSYMRLRSYYYSLPGAYFVTICTYNKHCLFGTIENDTMNLNPYGEIVQECWRDATHHYIGISNDAFIVMPNHVHGIIIIHDMNGRSGSKPDATRKHPLSEIVRAFKTYSSRRINEHRKSQGTSVWQRSYYERIIRNEKELHEIGEYIIYNPAKWDADSENPITKLN
jgi:putative transposase